MYKLYLKLVVGLMLLLLPSILKAQQLELQNVAVSQGGSSVAYQGKFILSQKLLGEFSFKMQSGQSAFALSSGFSLQFDITQNTTDFPLILSAASGDITNVTILRGSSVLSGYQANFSVSNNKILYASISGPNNLSQLLPNDIITFKIYCWLPWYQNLDLSTSANPFAYKVTTYGGTFTNVASGLTPTVLSPIASSTSGINLAMVSPSLSSVIENDVIYRSISLTSELPTNVNLQLLYLQNFYLNYHSDNTDLLEVKVGTTIVFPANGVSEDEIPLGDITFAANQVPLIVLKERVKKCIESTDAQDVVKIGVLNSNVDQPPANTLAFMPDNTVLLTYLSQLTNKPSANAIVSSALVGFTQAQRCPNGSTDFPNNYDFKISNISTSPVNQGIGTTASTPNINSLQNVNAVINFSPNINFDAASFKFVYNNSALTAIPSGNISIGSGQVVLSDLEALINPVSGKLDPGKELFIYCKYAVGIGNCNLDGLNSFIRLNVNAHSYCNGTLFNASEIKKSDAAQSDYASSTNGPVDMFANQSAYEVISYTPNLTVNNASNPLTVACTSDVFKAYLFLPDNFQMDATAGITLNSTSLTYTSQTVSGGTEYTISLPQSSPFVIDGTISAAVKVVCPSGTSPQDDYTRLLWKLVKVSGCTENSCLSAEYLDCNYWETFVHYQRYCPTVPDTTCPGGGCLGGCDLLINNFSAKRLTFGYQVPAGGSTVCSGNASLVAPGALSSLTAASLTTSGISLNRYYRCDNMRLEANGSGSVSGSSCSVNAEDVRIRVTYSPEVNAGSSSFNNLVLATTPNLSFVVAGQSYSGILVSGPVYNSAKNTFDYIFKPDVTTSTALSGSYNVSFSSDFFVQDVSVPELYVQRLRAYMYAETSSGTLGNESRGAKAYLIKPRVTLKTADVSTNVLCEEAKSITITLDKGVRGDDFPSEIRPIAVLSDLQYIIPSGYTFNGGTADFNTYENGSLICSGAVTLDNSVVSSQGDIDYLMLPVLDKTSSKTEITLLLSAIPSCGTSHSQVFSASASYSGSTTASYTQNSSCGSYSNTLSATSVSPRYTPVVISSIVQNKCATDALKFNLYVTSNVPYGKQWVVLTTPSCVNLSTTASNVTIEDSPNYSGNSGLKDYIVTFGAAVGSGGVPVSISTSTSCSACDNSTFSIGINTGYTCLTGSGRTSLVNSVDLMAQSCNVVNYGNASIYTRPSIALYYRANYSFSNGGNLPPKICENSVAIIDITNSLPATYSMPLINPAFTVATPGVTLVSAKLYKNNVLIGASSSIQNNTVNLGDILTTPPANDYVMFPGIGTCNTAGDYWHMELEYSKSCDVAPNTPFSVNLSHFNLCSNTNRAIVENAQTPILVFGFPTPLTSGPKVTAVNFVADATGAGNNELSVHLNISDMITLTDGAYYTLSLTLPQCMSVTLPDNSGLVQATSTINSGNATVTYNYQFSGLIKSVYDLVVSSSSACTGTKEICVATKKYHNQSCSGENSCLISGTISTSCVNVNLTPLSENYCETCELTCQDCIGSFSPEIGKKYVISTWAKEVVNPLAITYTMPEVRISFLTGTTEVAAYSYTPNLVTDKNIEGWQKIEGEFVVPACEKIKVTLKNNDNASSAQNLVLYDDIRIHPFNSTMKTYVYDPNTLRLMAELDERNYATYYEYDEEGKLIRVKKETEKGIVVIKESRTNIRKQQ